MTEAILSITIAVLVFSLLFFVYKREMRSRDDGEKYVQLVKEFATEQITSTHQIIERTFADYLKHIQKLETINVPKPVTDKMVQEILNRTPAMSEVNEIEKEEDNGLQMMNKDLTDIPITRDTQVVFEGDIPTEML